MRRNLYIDEDAWTLLQRQAADEGARQGRTVSVSEWIRMLAEAEATKPQRAKSRSA